MPPTRPEPRQREVAATLVVSGGALRGQSEVGPCQSEAAAASATSRGVSREVRGISDELATTLARSRTNYKHKT